MSARVRIDGVPYEIPGGFEVEERHLTKTIRTDRAVLRVSPTRSEDGTHEHVSRRNRSGRELLATTSDGVAIPLEWIDTSTVSPCPSDCDGDHETMYVQDLTCPLCGARLEWATGPDAYTIRRGTEATVRFATPAPASVVQVEGVWDEPVTFRADSVTLSGDELPTFEGTAFIKERREVMGL